jgi:hemerythrin-like domain-containing protein
MNTLNTSSTRRGRRRVERCPDDPLDFILYEHLRHRVMCDALDTLAAAETFDAAAVARLAEFIRSDLSMHVADEEDVFFPILRQRCRPEDEIDLVLQRMNREHADDRELSAQVRVHLLTAAMERRPLSSIPGAAEALKQFAHNQRRHMMLENAVLIPLARQRLTPEDFSLLGVRLDARRQLIERTPGS